MKETSKNNETAQLGIGAVISNTYHQGINDSIKTIESILDYKSNTKWGSALRFAVNQIESLKKENIRKNNVIRNFPDNVEIWKWWQTQNFQKEQGEQEYTMIYEIDLPKILKAFTEHFQTAYAISNSEVFEHYGKPFTSGRDLWDFLTAHYNFTPKT